MTACLHEGWRSGGRGISPRLLPGPGIFATHERGAAHTTTPPSCRTILRSQGVWQYVPAKGEVRCAAPGPGRRYGLGAFAWWLCNRRPAQPCMAVCGALRHLAPGSAPDACQNFTTATPLPDQGFPEDFVFLLDYDEPVNAKYP
jgi:hypothetical protein